MKKWFGKQLEELEELERPAQGSDPNPTEHL